MVIDSSFADLNQLIEEIATNLKIPNILIGAAVSLIRDSVLERTQFDILGLKPIKGLEKCTVPVMFAHGDDDSFILP